jgi:SNF2 family DNA or RNA helicase
MQASRKKMDALAAAWEERPAGVLFLGNGRARRLLAPGGRVAPRLRIESSGVDWFAVSAEWEAEGLALSDADVAALRSATSRFVRLPSGAWVRRETGEANDGAARLLADLGIEAGQPATRITLWQLAGAAEGSLEALEAVGADRETVAALRTLREKVARFGGIPPVRRPAGLRVTLRPYQRHGLDFLVHCASFGLGAILADDMGLGKTVQTLAWVAHLAASDPGGGPSLVVCPASVMHNWAREAARFAPRLRVLVLERGAARHALRSDLAGHDLIVTNYALLRRDLEAWRDVALRALVLDEAQNVKNPDAAVTRAAASLTARHRLALTGTPLENRALDLWSIMEIVNPGYLGSRRAFVERFDRADTPPHRRTLLAARLRPVMLRRLKQAVAPELPERIEERRDCELTPGQRRLYLAEAQRSRALLAKLGDSPEALRRHRIHVLAALTRLRQICCHPVLGGGKAGLGSGKFEALVELLEPLLAEGHKVLVFSQFVGCLRLLAAALAERAMPHHMLTGETVRRGAVVAAFEQDQRACVFLLSLKAAGTGLNLTAASYVVLFDPWWNPAVEAQAIDRTHRIGQDQTVIAYRLVARGTIEEKIWELQQRKAALVRDVLGEDGFGRALTRDDLAFLFEGDG